MLPRFYTIPFNGGYVRLHFTNRLVYIFQMLFTLTGIFLYLLQMPYCRIHAFGNFLHIPVNIDFMLQHGTI